jgi:PTS system nitrogen regulatory IIA component
MKLSRLVHEDRVKLTLLSRTKDGVLRELANLFDIDATAKKILLTTLKKREALGSTGVGKGVAIPHCRSLLLHKLTVAVGRSKSGIDFGSLDRKPVHIFFLVVAPPQTASSEYLITLGRIARIAREMTKDERAMKIKDSREFLAFLDELESRSS